MASAGAADGGECPGGDLAAVDLGQIALTADRELVAVVPFGIDDGDIDLLQGKDKVAGDRDERVLAGEWDEGKACLIVDRDALDGRAVCFEVPEFHLVLFEP